MAEEIAAENGRIFNFQRLMTLTLTLDRVILHTVVHHSSTSTYMPNFIEIKETFYGCTYDLIKAVSVCGQAINKVTTCRKSFYFNEQFQITLILRLLIKIARRSDNAELPGAVVSEWRRNVTRSTCKHSTAHYSSILPVSVIDIFVL